MPLTIKATENIQAIVMNKGRNPARARRNLEGDGVKPDSDDPIHTWNMNIGILS